MSIVVQISLLQICNGFCDEIVLGTDGNETFVLGLKMFTLTLGLELLAEHTRLSWVLFPNVIFFEIDAVILLYVNIKVGISKKEHKLKHIFISKIKI